MKNKVTIMIDEELMKELRLDAIRSGKKYSEAIEDAIRKYLQGKKE